MFLQGLRFVLQELSRDLPARINRVVVTPTKNSWLDATDEATPGNTQLLIRCAVRILTIFFTAQFLNGAASADAIIVSRAMSSTSIMEVFIEESCIAHDRRQIGIGRSPARGRACYDTAFE